MHRNVHAILLSFLPKLIPSFSSFISVLYKRERQFFKLAFSYCLVPCIAEHLCYSINLPTYLSIYLFIFSLSLSFPSTKNTLLLCLNEVFLSFPYFSLHTPFGPIPALSAYGLLSYDYDYLVLSTGLTNHPALTPITLSSPLSPNRKDIQSSCF